MTLNEHFNRYKVELTLMEPMLGTVPKSKQLYRDFIIKKAEREGVKLSEEQIVEELATIEEMEEKGWTGFHTENGGPAIYNYMIKGFLKAACSSLRRVSGTKSHKLVAHKKVIDNLVHVYPRLILLDLNGGEMGVLERPLRAQTAKGERVALARSDTAPVGTTIEFKLKVLGNVVNQVLLEEWLDFGELIGLGQWRSGGWGQFSYQIERLK